MVEQPHIVDHREYPLGRIGAPTVSKLAIDMFSLVIVLFIIITIIVIFVL